MKKYSVQTGWIGRVPVESGNIEVIAISRAVARMCVLVDYVDLPEIVAEISADDPTSQGMMPRVPTNLMCGSKLLIAN